MWVIRNERDNDGFLYYLFSHTDYARAWTSNPQKALKFSSHKKAKEMVASCEVISSLRTFEIVSRSEAIALYEMENL